MIISVEKEEVQKIRTKHQIMNICNAEADVGVVEDT